VAANAEALGAPPPPLAAGTAEWPATVPSAVEAADALSMGIAGVFPPSGSPLAVVAEVMAGMSPLERAVLLGEPQPIDPAPVRGAAVMRVRVAVALSSAPPPGSPVDAGAVSALLGEIDALLTKVNAIVAGAPPELQPSLEQVRNAVVKEAIDFSEAAHRAASELEAQPAAPGVTGAARRAAQTRMLSVASEAERQIDRIEEKRRRTAWVILAVVIILGGGFHGYEYWKRRVAIASSQAARITRTGAPADATVNEPARGAPVVIQSKGGRPFTPEELKRMEEEEGLRGNTVRQASPSSVIILPSGSGRGSGAPAPAPGR
jgi:hypothetical protein